MLQPRGRGDEGRICHTSPPQEVSKILGQETEFLGKHVVSPKRYFSPISFKQIQNPGVLSLGTGKGTKVEAGISLLGLSRTKCHRLRNMHNSNSVVKNNF